MVVVVVVGLWYNAVDIGLIISHRTFRTHLSAPHHHTRAMRCDLIIASHAHRMLIGACNPDGLPDGVPDVGLQVLKVVDTTTEPALFIGAANTIIVTQNGTLHGDNTDWIGVRHRRHNAILYRFLLTF